ncbi:MAG: AMP-binding protein [Deltaproteobacteria bacterium]|nr:AMP-binding protein [Deltaproteobacteria bacterium]
MSKGAVGLTAGYWPEDVYRYLAIPGIALDDALISRPAKRHPDQPALIGYQETLTYRQLSEAIDQTMKGIHSCTEGKAARLAVAMRQPINVVKLLFGALKGRCTIMLADPARPGEDLVASIRHFGADLVLIDDPKFQTVLATLEGVPIMQFQELVAKQANIPGPKGRQDLQAPAVAFAMENGSLVYHSHRSLLAGAVSWSTFVPLKAEDLMLAVQPLSRWEGLYSVLPIFFRGGACLVADLEDPETLAAAVQSHQPCFTILPRTEARKLYDSAYRSLVRAFRDALRGLFVSTAGPFTAIGRRRLKNLLDKPALLTYGSVEAGPVLSSHPTWYLDAAVGIPLTNVDVWPLNPASGKPLEVPWEAIEFGEVGVKSPLVGIKYEPAQESEKLMQEGWLRTKIVTTMDPNGLFYIQSRVPD